MFQFLRFYQTDKKTKRFWAEWQQALLELFLVYVRHPITNKLHPL
jgi:hypothetical protein